MKTPEILDRPTWIDCNAHGAPHRWTPSQVPNYWDCTQCPVSTFRCDHGDTATGKPPAVLVRDETERS